MARTSIATDDFNRASLGSNWGQVGPFAGSGGNILIDSSIRIYGGGGGDAAARWVGAGTFTDDQYSSLKVKDVGTDFSYVGVIARASADQDSSRDYYLYWMRGIFGTTQLEKCVNGTTTVLDNTPASLSWLDDDLIEIECEGTAIRGMRNVSTQHSATDSALTTGAPGVFAAHVSVVPPFGDDWDGGNLGSAAGLSPQLKSLLAMSAINRAAHF